MHEFVDIIHVYTSCLRYESLQLGLKKLMCMESSDVHVNRMKQYFEGKPHN